MTKHEPTDVVYLSRRDERANAITHAIGFVASLLAGVALWFHPASPSFGQSVAASVFVVAMAGVYFCSTMSHVVYEPRRRHRWRAWDQGVIYTMIAGTYTPFIYSFSPEGWRVTILLLVWLAAAFGFSSKVLVRYRVSGISTVTYILLGWLPAIPLASRTPWECLAWMVAGGLAYTLGIIFLTRDKHVTYFHAMWHLMVMAGSAFHFIAVYRIPYLS
ncbi:PAQR family membrane homeostasis protein TrhA [Planctomycetaceae bacterium SH139]